VSEHSVIENAFEILISFHEQWNWIRTLAFFMAPGIQAFAPTIPGAAQPLGKEFPASAPWIIQGAIKFSQSSGHKGVVANE
jgi:hypothetical protein